MGVTLKEQFIQAMLRFRKVGMTLPPQFDIRISELFVLREITKNTTGTNIPVYVSEIHSNLHITGPAVSQMLKTLEKKGYISRQMDMEDRRKIAVTLTPKGEDILKQAEEYTNNRLEEVISRFGEENTRQIVDLFTLLAEISEELKEEPLK